MNSKPNPLTVPVETPWSSNLLGTVFGLISAVSYTISNVYLRSVSDCDPVFVSAVKSVPTVLVMGPWLIYNLRRGSNAVTSWRALWWLLAASVLGQIGGNVLFQMGLGVIGIALTVPTMMGMLIVSGAAFGYWMLGEPVSRRSRYSIVILITAIFILSFSSGDAHEAVRGTSVAADPAQWWILIGSVLAACSAGLSYSLLGVSIRHSVTSGISIPATMVTVGLAGVVGLGAISVANSGWTVIQDAEPIDLYRMTLAGIWNTIAFFALTQALTSSSLVHVNGLNATQVAMASLVGVVMFQEAFTSPLIAGVVLTICGVLLMDR